MYTAWQEQKRISASRELTPKVVLWSTWTSWPTYPALTPQTPFEIRPHCRIHRDSWPDLGFLSSPSVRIAGLRQTYATVSGLMWKTHTAVFHVYPLSQFPGPGALVAIISLNIFHPRWFAYMHGCGTSSATTPSPGALRFVREMPGASVVPPGLLRMLVGFPLILSPLSLGLLCPCCCPPHVLVSPTEGSADQVPCAAHLL